MTMSRAHIALLFASAALCAPVTAAHAQANIPLTETEAINRALVGEGYGALETAERDAAQADIAAVRRFDNPRVGIEHESVGDEREWQVGVVQPIDISGRRSALRDAARAEAAATDASIVRRRQLLIADVRGVFARCASAEAELGVLSRFVTQLTEAARSVTVRADTGDTAYYDVRRVRVALRGAEAEQTVAAGEVSAECGRLGILTGTTGARADASGLRSLTNATDRDRADLVALEARALAASQQVTAARAARLPELELGAGVRRISDPTGSATGPTVSVGFTVPLFNNGGAAVTAANARRRAAEAEVQIARRQVAAEQAETLARMIAARDAAATAALARDDASRLGTIAETAYRSGEVGVVELVDAFEAARDADLSVITLNLAAAEALIAHDLAIGGIVP